jgi:hypothetical protein
MREVKAYRLLLAKSERNRALGRSRRGWVNNIKMNLEDVEWDRVGWTEVAQDRDTW